VSRRVVLGTAGAVVVLLLVWYQFLWSPKGADIASAHERTTTAQSKAQELQTRLDSLVVAKRDLPALVDRQVRLKAAVPDTPDLAGFLLAANEAATKAGVDYLNVAPALPATTTPGLPPAITVALNVTGGYSQVLDYLDRLATLPRVVVVDHVQVSPGVKDGSDPKLSITLTARTFAGQGAPPTAVTAPGAAPAPAGASPPTTVAAATTTTGMTP
jgi:type IV pilus assembly protein PilO